MRLPCWEQFYVNERFPFIDLKDYLSLTQKSAWMDQGEHGIERLAPKQMQKPIPEPKNKTKSRIGPILLGKAIPRVILYAQSFGLLETLIFSEVNEINYSRTMAG